MWGLLFIQGVGGLQFPPKSGKVDSMFVKDSTLQDEHHFSFDHLGNEFALSGNLHLSRQLPLIRFCTFEHRCCVILVSTYVVGFSLS